MKKLLPWMLTAIICFGLVTGCQSTPAPAPAPAATTDTAKPADTATTDTTKPADTATTDTTKPADTATTPATDNTVATGIGVTTSISKSKSAADGKDGNAQAYSNVVVVSTDKDGKITKCTIDAVQSNMAISATGTVTSDKTKLVPSKNELGEAYGMKKASKIAKEWNEQAQAFADWTIGKTVDEVKGLKTKAVGTDPTVPDSPDLAASVTISVGDLVEAIAKAATYEGKPVAVTGDYKTGLGMTTTIARSVDATADKPGTAEGYTNIAAVTLDSTGKILTCKIDAQQTQIAFDAKGQITSDLASKFQTKDELGEAYGMKKASKIAKEWNEQAQAFADWSVGKTLDEVKALKTKAVGTDPTVPDSPDLTASVTISVGDFVAAIDKAVANAK